MYDQLYGSVKYTQSKCNQVFFVYTRGREAINDVFNLNKIATLNVLVTLNLNCLT